MRASIRGRKSAALSLVGSWDVGSATITSVTAWRYWDWKPANDRDFIGLPITTVSQNPSQQKQFSQELRIASNGERKLNYTLGAFFFNQTINTQGSQVQGPAASRWLLSGADASNPNVLNGLTSTNTISFDNTSFAVFGKLNWAGDRQAAPPAWPARQLRQEIGLLRLGRQHRQRAVQFRRDGG